MYNVSEIEMYANLILHDIKTAIKNHNKIPICGVSQF